MNEENRVTRESIAGLKRFETGSWNPVLVWAQVESSVEKTTRDGKPFREITLTDGTEKCVLRVWSDAPEFNASAPLKSGTFLELQGEVTPGTTYGPEFRRWQWRGLEEEERALFLVGSQEVLAKQEMDWNYLMETTQAIRDPRLARLCALFFEEFGAKFRRTAAARSYHHARRGGLAEHTAQMMRCAVALAPIYPEVNQDLLVAGVLFHDCGKMWENPVAEESLQIGFTEIGELMGHISLGMEIVNHLWRKMKDSGELAGWEAIKPSSESARMHLVHLVASHHGTHEFGSPVLPKTPEAFLLHHIDNLDAKMESVRMGYAKSVMLTPTIRERGRPLNVNLVTPLAVVDRTVDP